MSFVLWPPELISGLMYSGSGSGPMMAAAAAWDSLAADLYSAATSNQSVITDLTTGVWQGPSSVAMSTATTRYMAWLHATAEQVEQVGAQAKAAAGAFETAFAATVPPPMIASNRALLAALVATNVLGQNAPAIAAVEALYAEYWAQDAFALDSYALSSQQAMVLPQHSSPPPVANGLPGTEAVAAVKSVGLNTLASGPLDSSGSLSDLLALLNSPEAAQVMNYGARFGMYPINMLMQLAKMGQQTSTTGMTGSQGLMNSIGQLVDGKLQSVMGGVTNQLKSFGSAVSAQLGQARSVGGLSVPQAWSASAPAITRAAPVLPHSTVNTPALSSAMPGGPFTQAMMGALSGRGLGSLAAKVPKVIPRSPAGG